MFDDDVETVVIDQATVLRLMRPMTTIDRLRHRLADWLQLLAEFVQP